MFLKGHDFSRAISSEDELGFSPRGKTIFDSANPVTHERPAGITALTYLFALASLLLLVYTAALAAEAISFTRASWLVGEGVARMGPFAIALSAALCAAISFGLFRLNRFARWAAIAFLAYGLLETVPALMAALSNFSPLLLAISAAQFLVRTIALWYLFQSPVRDFFSGQRHRWF